MEDCKTGKMLSQRFGHGSECYLAASTTIPFRVGPFFYKHGPCI